MLVQSIFLRRWGPGGTPTENHDHNDDNHAGMKNGANIKQNGPKTIQSDI